MGGTPCAACKLLRRKCEDDCVFAPHFPASNPEKFKYIHKVFGASNVSKILHDLHPHQREAAVRSLVYEAGSLESDPVHGCVGHISFLHEYLTRLQYELLLAKQELAHYMGPPFRAPPQLGNNVPPNFMIPQGRPLVIREPNSSQQHQQELQDEHLKRMAAEFVNRGDHQNGFGIENNGFVTAKRGFSHMNDQGPSGLISGPTLDLGSFGDNYAMEQEVEEDHMNHDQASNTEEAPRSSSANSEMGQENHHHEDLQTDNKEASS